MNIEVIIVYRFAPVVRYIGLKDSSPNIGDHLTSGIRIDVTALMIKTKMMVIAKSR